ncbi:MAG: DNA translocase FtsK 4TM domain-containing protein, partial [Desulfobaccales bacterium]
MAKRSAPKESGPRKSRMAAAPPSRTKAWPRRLGQEMIALLLLGLAGFFLLALGSHSLQDPQGLLAAWKRGGVQNAGGKAGAMAAAYAWWSLGWAAFWIPLSLLGLAWQSHRRGLKELGWRQTAACLGMILSTAGLLYLVRPYFSGNEGLRPGGILGELLGKGLLRVLNRPGATLALALTLLLSFMALTRLSYVGLISYLGGIIDDLWHRGGRRRRWLGEAEARSGRTRAKPQAPAISRQGGETGETLASPPPLTAVAPAAPARPKPVPVPVPVPGKFTLPPLDLLDPSQPWNYQVQEGTMEDQARKLEDTLRHFGVEGRVAAIMTGPVVSRFEYEPALGVKISKITGLADDLALALKAMSIRIVAPVPGKGVLGIEIPNPKRQVVALREILSDAAYQKSASKLTLALGKDIMGAPVVTDLVRMPHLLIAGATGSGKSVGLNAMILSILFKATPEEVRFLLIDPKRIELSLYEGIPHLLHPVVFNPKEATIALHWAVGEMERRYAMLSDLSARNIEGYNQKARVKKSDPRVEEGILPRSLPYLVIVIDELADLMLVSSRDTEEYLIRLAQKARAAGIHLMVATQRPSVDVITGLIKANFPTRVSYQVSARADSRVILDSMGAERLLGMGDLLFLPPGTSLLKRIHGPFVTEEEVTRVVDFLKVQATPLYEAGITELKELEEEVAENGERDEKYADALELVAETRNASISMLQRRLRVGYNRAARIIETMEKEGLIGPS